MRKITSFRSGFDEYISNSHDITDMTFGIEKKQALISERHNALGMIASGIAHEINGPLATVKACSEGLIRRVEKDKYDPALFKNYLEIIEEEIDRCTFITGNILRFMRKHEEPNNHYIDVHSSLDKTLGMVELQGRFGSIEIVRNYENKILITSGNECELRQVFLAIITNAIDAMQESGKLTLGTHAYIHSILISINNTGDPIPPEYIKNIFDPYFTTKEKQGGTGLGLFLANKIIKAWGGRIDVVSDSEEGTTFTIDLPSQPSG